MAVDGIAADTALLQMAVEYKKTIATETRNILTVSDIEQKRRSFQPLSDAMFDLLRTTRYQGSKVYQQYCPMAFDNSGAAWLSNSPDVVNPYFGDAMLHCGELRDSVRQ
jgi:Cu(I)/Ag(I) efflux system membrane fusion protein